MKLPSKTQIISAYARFKEEGFGSKMVKTKNENLFLKAESTLLGGSYKIRGVREYFEQIQSSRKAIKVLSAGNLALATAIESSRRTTLCQAVVPIGVSEIKKSRLQDSGAEIMEVPFSDLWDLVNKTPDQLGGEYLHPLNSHLLCGYATMALEIREQLPTYDALVIPYGLGGLALSLAHGCAVEGLKTKIYITEIAGHSPLKMSLEQGRPMPSPKLQSFIEALGTPEVLPSVFEKIQYYSPEVILVSEEETKDGIRELHQDYGLRVEGAAGAAYTAAKKVTSQKSEQVVAILSGGNISDDIFQKIVGSSL
jgi:threonine dehydratase